MPASQMAPQMPTAAPPQPPGNLTAPPTPAPMPTIGLMDRLEGGQMDRNSIIQALNDGSIANAWAERYAGRPTR